MNAKKMEQMADNTKIKSIYKTKLFKKSETDYWRCANMFAKFDFY